MILVDFSVAFLGSITVLKDICENVALVSVLNLMCSLFDTSLLEGHTDFPSIFPFTLYVSMQDNYVCYFWMVYEEICGKILSFLLIIFLGSVNRLLHYLVSLDLSILFAHLKQVMNNITLRLPVLAWE